jgi:hypothetical protein
MACHKLPCMKEIEIDIDTYSKLEEISNQLGIKIEHLIETALTEYLAEDSP